MRLSVLPNSETPAYRQICDQLAAAILSGELRAGEALPPIRTVSKELGVSVITVRSAWDALEHTGLIETRVGSGCFVRALSETQREALREEAIRAPLAELIEAGKTFGFTAPELCEKIRRAYGPDSGGPADL